VGNSFVHRQIDVSFTLGEGSFGTSGQNTTKLSGLRTSCQISKAGAYSMGTLAAAIYGMQLSDMNKLSTLGMVAQLVRRNSILIEAGDQNGKAVVFNGTITNAWFDGKSAPEVAFRVEAQTGLIESVDTAPPSSYPDTVDVADIMASLAGRMGLAFENSGVSVILSNQYLSGSPRAQAAAAAKAASINWIIDNGTLAIWPKGGSRKGEIPLISPTTGLIGYPAYTSKGLEFQALFTPQVGFGNKVKIQQETLGDSANGEWVVLKLDYDLESEVPNGRWFMDVQASRPGFVPVVIGGQGGGG
jgi:hypothetical protein